jgi:hypothetical protein
MRRTAILGVIVGGLTLSLFLFVAASLSGRSSPNEGDPIIGTDPVAASLTPVSFTQIIETNVDGRPVLRLSGIAEPNATIALLDRGERVRQVRVTPQGVWSSVIDVSGPGMAIEAILFDVAESETLDTATTSIRGMETIFRIRQPGDAHAQDPALIMVSAPGAPTQLIQSPFGGQPTNGPLSISAIDYDDTGGVIFSGRSEQAGRVRLYLSNAAIGETRVGSDGRWTYIASSVMPLGEYDVRAELLVGPNDNPVVSVPFERLPPLPDPGTDDGALSVSFTSYRWQVRRSLIGGGMQSTVIFAP